MRTKLKDWFEFGAEILLLILILLFVKGVYVWINSIMALAVVMIFIYKREIPFGIKNFVNFKRTNSLNLRILYTVIIVLLMLVYCLYLLCLGNYDFSWTQISSTTYKTILITPIVEEIIFRHYANNRLENMLGSTFQGIAATIVLSSLIFAIPHVASNLSTPLYLIGLAFIRALFITCAYYYYRKNLLIPIFLHIMVNTMATFKV